MTKLKALRAGTSMLVVGAFLGLSGCEVTLVENRTSAGIREARVASQTRGDSRSAEALLRQAIYDARDPKLRMVAEYELGRILVSKPTNSSRVQEGLGLLGSASATYAPAQAKLGQMYAEGDGVRKDELRATQYLRAAAQGGHAGAQLDLATLIRKNPALGSPIEASRLASAAISKLQADSRKGDANASRQLGQLYRDGLVVPANRAESERYYSMAVRQGQTKAVTELAEMWMNGSPADRQKALRLLEMGADRDVGRAVILLGDLYRNGTITQADRDRALAYYLRGATSYDDSTVSRVASTLRMGGVSAERRSQATQYLQSAAASGSAKAAMELGKISENGGNLGAAAKYYRTAANAGLPEAKMRLGRLLFEGKGVGRDYAGAVKLLDAASRAGYNEADAYLGRAYAEGNGVAQDWTKARTYLEKGIKGGSTSAAVFLAQAYWDGLGGPANPTEAVRLFKFAADRGSVTAMNALAEAYRTGRGVAPNQDLALQWTERAAKGGSSSALVDTGWAYATGNGVPRDMVEANRYFQSAVDRDPSKAGQIARALRDGSKGVVDTALADYYADIARLSGDPQELRNQARGLESSDPAQAEAAYREAARNGDTVAMIWLAERAFASGDGAGGRRLLDQAASGGNGEAAQKLGAIYAFGDGVGIDLGRALSYYKRGAELGNGESMYWVSMFYRQGLGVPVDTRLADEWLAKARAAGYSVGL